MMKKLLFSCALMLLGLDLMAQNGHRGLDVNVDLGYLLATKSEGVDAQFATLSVGKRFNEYLFAGAGSGAEIGGLFKSGRSPETVVPFFADIRGYLPLERTKLTPFLGIKGGYMLHAGSAGGSDGIFFQIAPGVQFPLSSIIDINVAAGYEHYFPTKDGYDSSGVIVFKVGFAFHK
ncbi:MAG: hypothetical protein IJV44_09675 [Prevotella sp.]|nr:hypothetical protein [Prevotella sp.]